MIKVECSVGICKSHYISKSSMHEDSKKLFYAIILMQTAFLLFWKCVLVAGMNLFEVQLTNNGWRYKSLNLFVSRCSEVTTPAAADQLFDLFHCRWRSNLRSTFGCWTAWLLMIHNHEIVFWLPDFHRRSTLEWTAKLGWLFHRVSTYYYSFWLHYKNHWKLYLVKMFKE